MRLIVIIIILWSSISYSLISTTLINNNFLKENEIKKNIKYINHENINIIEKEKIIEKLKLALYAISEIEHSKTKIKEYQNIIDNFPSIIHQLHSEKKIINNEEYLQKNNHKKNHNNNTTSSNELRKFQIEINQKLAILDQKLQQEQNLVRSINNSLILLPQQHAETKKELNEINRKISHINTTKISHLEQAKLIALQAEKEAKQFKITELELAQLSANNRQEISRLHIELLKNKYDQLNKKSYILHTQLHKIQEQETTQTINTIEKLSNTTKNHMILPQNIIQQFQINRTLLESLKKQIHNINLITLQQREIATYILNTREALAKLLEQAKWITKSTALGETLRTQISKLAKPKIHKIQQIDIKMTKLRTKRLEHEEQINNLPLLSLQNTKEYQTLTNNQKNILNTQINIQRKLLNSLLTNYDIQILELTKLKIAYEQLHDITKETDKAIHRHLFWIADTYPITLSYPSKIYQDLYLLINKDIFNQLKYTTKAIFSKNTKILTILFIYLLFTCLTYTTYHRHYYFFLIQSKKQLKKNYQKYFLLTIKNIFWSNVITLPIPTLWIMLGYSLSQTWESLSLSIIGEKMIYFTPILWLAIIIRYFSLKNGLFILYFKWNEKKINKIMYHYSFHVIIIIFTFIALITFNTYNNQEFHGTLGRFWFIILCFCLTYITYILKKENLPLYTNKHGLPNNTINRSLWNLIVIFPIISASASYFGYLALAQTLLINLEASLIIWTISLIVYHTILCWIITQKHHILSVYQENHKKILTDQYFNINKKQLLPIFLHHINNFIDSHTKKNNITKKNINNPNIILNNISNKSLQFIRFIITLVTLTIIFFLWSEFHFIFNFLKEFTLWDITSTIQEKNNIQPITLGMLLTGILILFITTQTVKNLPPLLEMIILQYLHLTPGTNYAVITLTKYTIMAIGITAGCAHLGFEWSKLQWLLAAIGVGLGFGLQEIFANFISGLIILFEKPIRIGDTITISELTGNITEINTRATTIIDRNHKEIIIPNKEFITKKFVNWSLSDTITRVVLKAPAPAEANTTQIIKILLDAATNCPLVLQTPKPEVYLIDIQQGIPLFEIRMYTSKMHYRMPLRHQVHMLIIEFYEKNGLQLPFPHIYIHNDKIRTTKKT